MVMAADNAVVEADNASEVAPEVDETEVVAEEPEAEPEPTPEAEAPLSLADLLAGRSEDELLEVPTIKDTLRRREESARRKAEHETTTKMFAQEREFVASGEAERALLALAEAAAENIDERGRAKLDPREVKKLTAALLSHGSSAAVNQLATVLATEIGDGFELTQAESDSIELARQKYMQNPLDPAPLQRAWLGPLRRAWVSQERESIKAEVRAEMKREQEAAAKVAGTKAATEKRKETPGITSVSGAPVGTPMTWADIDKKYTDSQWMSLPAETRKSLSEQADAARLTAR